MIVAMAENSESCRDRGGALMVNAGGGRRERQFGVVCCRHAGGREVVGSSSIKVGFPRCHRPMAGLAPDAQLCWC